MATFSLGFNNYTLQQFTALTTAHSANTDVNKAVVSEPVINTGSGIFSDGGNPEVVVSNFTASPSGFDFTGGNLSVTEGRNSRAADKSAGTTISYGGSIVRDAVVKGQNQTKTMSFPVQDNNYPGYTFFGEESKIQYIRSRNFAGFITYF
jgi:hypothetical protein